MAPTGKKVRCFCPECRGKTHIQMKCRIESLPEPDDSGKVDITGRYEENRSRSRITCQINQAGIHVEGWLQTGHAVKDKIERVCYSISGDMFDKQIAQFNIVLKDLAGKIIGQGSLRARPREKLEIDTLIRYQPPNNNPVRFHYYFKRYPLSSKIPRLSDDAILHFPESIKRFIIATETASLPSYSFHEIYQRFRPEYIRDLIIRWREKRPSSINLMYRRHLIAQEEKNSNYKSFYTHVKEFFNLFHPDLRPLLCWHIRYHLSQFKIKEGDSKSALSYLEDIVSRTINDPEEYYLFGKNGLNLIRDLVDKEYHYEAELSVFEPNISLELVEKPFFQKMAKLVIHKAIGVGFWKGILTVKKTAPLDNTWRPNPAKFDLVFYGISVGKNIMFPGEKILSKLKLEIPKIDIPKVGKIEFGKLANLGAGTYGFISKGTAVTYANWLQENFRGSALWIDVSAFGALGAGPSYGIISELLVYGDKNWEPLSFDFSGFSWALGFGIGGAGKIYYGDIIPHGTKVKVPSPKISFPVTSTTEAEIHFDLGCSVIEPEGRNAIRRMCAQELYFMHSPNSFLQIYAYTDRVGCALRNIELSLLRAMNVLQAIKDTMGKRIAMGPRIKVNIFCEEDISKAVKEIVGKRLDQISKIQWKIYILKTSQWETIVDMMKDIWNTLGKRDYHEPNIQLNLYGEGPAKKAGLPDSAQDREWRKVEVFLNGRGVAKLQDKCGDAEVSDSSFQQ